MAGKRDKPEEIIAKLRQVEVLQGQGMKIADAARQIGITQQTYYRWRKEYGRMNRDQLRRLKELEKENARLRRAVWKREGLTPSSFDPRASPGQGLAEIEYG
jgi:putative transposase